jgi:hypothetical protein
MPDDWNILDDWNLDVFRFVLNSISSTGLGSDATQDCHFRRFADCHPGDRRWSRRHP